LEETKRIKVPAVIKSAPLQKAGLASRQPHQGKKERLSY
jgi:hypothetical protein